jgi:hypothetical protein
MDQEFHYWITGIVACRAGFSECESAIIAYSSQLVDDNDILRKIVDVQNPGSPPYEVYISQTMDILKPKQELMRIYPIFHFLPGRYDAPSARRADGKMHILTTTPDSELANKVLDAALTDMSAYRLHRIGVAAHAFADTWAHQNFVGWYDGINGENLNPLPNIGHADFKHHPDWVGHRWDDSRILDKEVTNNNRFLVAARRLYDKFSDTTKKASVGGWTGLENDLIRAMGPVYSGELNHGRDARMARMTKYQSLSPWLPEYDPNTWFDAAVLTKVRGLPDGLPPEFTIFKDQYFWKLGWQDSNWYKFQEAVKAHQAMCMNELQPVFDQMGVDLSKH